ncbi:unnamed protein product [Lactuca virosa]|uniref:Uncharacterized protein n=1 Tax=Lactuca virosa TaxID=75947 RepID=A0AAU9N9X2_9ASTR|nr:unnamed protein product [Lactuca virosa]
MGRKENRYLANPLGSSPTIGDVVAMSLYPTTTTLFSLFCLKLVPSSCQMDLTSNNLKRCNKRTYMVRGFDAILVKLQIVYNYQKTNIFLVLGINIDFDP